MMIFDPAGIDPADERVFIAVHQDGSVSTATMKQICDGLGYEAHGADGPGYKDFWTWTADGPQQLTWTTSGADFDENDYADVQVVLMSGAPFNTQIVAKGSYRMDGRA